MSEGSIHVFRSSEQEATKYVCDAGIELTFKSRECIYALCCQKPRWAKNLVVQAYYDGDRFFCKDGKGCKK